MTRPREVSRARGEAMRAKLRHAAAVSRDGDHEQALSLAGEVEADVLAHGAVSAHALWSLAVFSDYAGRLLDALGYVLRALSADPAMVPGEQSLHIIVGKCREAVLDGDGPVEERVALFEALAENSLDDDQTRVAHAECLLAQGKHEDALRVAQAIVTLAPRTTAAWRVVHAAAKAVGDAKLAAEAASRCMSTRCAEGPSPVPNVAWGQA